MFHTDWYLLVFSYNGLKPVFSSIVYRPVFGGQIPATSSLAPESGEVKTGNYGFPDIFGNAYFPDMFGNYGFPNRKRLWKLGPRP